MLLLVKQTLNFVILANFILKWKNQLNSSFYDGSFWTDAYTENKFNRPSEFCPPVASYANVFNTTIHFAICIPANCFSFPHHPNKRPFISLCSEHLIDIVNWLQWTIHNDWLRHLSSLHRVVCQLVWMEYKLRLTFFHKILTFENV